MKANTLDVWNFVIELIGVSCTLVELCGIVRIRDRWSGRCGRGRHTVCFSLFLCKVIPDKLFYSLQRGFFHFLILKIPSKIAKLYVAVNSNSQIIFNLLKFMYSFVSHVRIVPCSFFIKCLNKEYQYHNCRILNHLNCRRGFQ